MIADTFLMTIATLVLLLPIALVAAGPALVGAVREMRERRAGQLFSPLVPAGTAPDEDRLAV